MVVLCENYTVSRRVMNTKLGVSFYEGDGVLMG